MTAATATAPAAPLRRSLPGVGELFAVWRDPLGVMLDGMQQGDPVVGFRFGPHRYFLINEPAGVEHVLLRNAKAYRKAPTYDALRLVLGQGLVTSEGALWRRQRRLVQPAFHHRALRTFADTIVDLTDEMLETWMKRGADQSDAYQSGAVRTDGPPDVVRTACPAGAVHTEGPPDPVRAACPAGVVGAAGPPGVVGAARAGLELDVHREMNALTFRVVGRTLFSTDLAEDTPRVAEALEFLMAFAARRAEGSTPIPIWFPTRSNLRYRRMRTVLDDLVRRMVAARRGVPRTQADLLDLLLAATDEDGAMSSEQLRDELITMALAGHETTSNALAFIWYLLSKHPDVQRRIRSEVEDQLGGRRPRFDDLPNLPLVERVMKESLRLFPPAWIMERQTLEEDVVAGYALPSRALVGIAPYTLHRDPRWWPNPEGFEPDRFKPDLERNRPRFAYLPFGGGPRICIGNTFAMMEIRLILVRMLQKVNLELRPGFRLRLDPGITLRPRGGIAMRASRYTPRAG